MFHEIINFRNIHLAVTVSIRHLIIHLGDYDFRVFGGGPGVIDGDTETYFSVLIRRCDHDQRDIDRNLCLE